MNGFIYYRNKLSSQAPNPKRVAPILSGSIYHLKSFEPGGYLLTWGNSCGDIWCIDEGGKQILILSGYISEFENGPEFRSQLEAANHLFKQFMSAKSDEELKIILARIYGSFAILFHDREQDITICVTDRVSSRPLWRSLNNSGWIISTHATAIALSLDSPQIDIAGLGAFMLYGGPLAPARSLFKGVNAIPSGSIMRLGSNGQYSMSRWYKFRHQDNTDFSKQEWNKLVADRLVNSAARIGNHSEKIAIFFSGGTDSRLAASAFKSAGFNPSLVTLADSNNIEVGVARLASKALGLDHTVIIRDPHWYLRNLPLAVYETGGSYLWRHGHFSAAADIVSKKCGINAFLLGDFCEAFSKLFCAPERERTDVWATEDFYKMFDSIRLPLYRPQNMQRTLLLFNHVLKNELEDAIRFEITDRFKEVSQLSRDPLIVGDLFFRWENVLSLPTFFMFLDLRSITSERNIMFDRDVHELLEIMPSKMRDGNNLGANVINQLQPLAAWVMNSNSLIPMILPSSIHMMSKKMKPTFGKVRRLFFGKSHRTTGSWPEHAALYVSDRQWRQCFEKILGDERLFDMGIFDREAIRQSWESLLKGEANRSEDVEKLVQLGLLYRLLDKGATQLAEDVMYSNILGAANEYFCNP